jgi:murein peptide amidase A
MQEPPLKRMETLVNSHSVLASKSTFAHRPKVERPAANLLGRLDQLSQKRKHLYSSPISLPSRHKPTKIPRYIFIGDQPGESAIRLGIFAGLRGDDIAGSQAIVQFIDDLVTFPSLGSAFRIYAYPMMNLPGLATAPPPKQSDQSPIHEPGSQLKFPEAHLFKREIFVVQFHGLVLIHSANEQEGLRAGVFGANLREALVFPILSSLQSIIPTAELAAPDFPLSPTGDAVLKQKPFELTLSIPQSGWQSLYSMALRIALHTLVDRYRSHLAHANNI